MQTIIGSHPLADIFPFVEGGEFDALASDIRDHGQREPIVLYDGLILDGRNRYRACAHIGVEPIFTQYEGNDPTSYVISLNLRRRHLNESQRAMVAAKLANLEHGGIRRGDQAANLRFENDNRPAPVSTERAASMLNVSGRSVETARNIQRNAIPDLAQAVDRGEVSVSAAATVARLEHDAQRGIVEHGAAAVRDAARDIRENGLANRTSFTGNNEWYTPADFVELARTVLGTIDVDPASNSIAQETVKADVFYTEADNGLDKEWNGRVWLNPPYAQPAIGHFVDKIIEEVQAGRTTQAIMLTHNYTDTAWFQKAAKAATCICFKRGRVRFVSPTGELASPTQGQAFFYFGADREGFACVFGEVGFVT